MTGDFPVGNAVTGINQKALVIRATRSFEKKNDIKNHVCIIRHYPESESREQTFIRIAAPISMQTRGRRIL